MIQHLVNSFILLFVVIDPVCLAPTFAALTEGAADAVLAASIFHYGTYSVAAAKRYLASRGIPVRPA